MIKLNGVSKVYESKNKDVCYALNDLSLTLPDVGTVFVVGKSGSGKSSFLNLIGGLDNITSGAISVNGNELTKLSENELSNYRNTHIGFIFQDYHLIDTLTVYENVVLSLKLQHQADDLAVSRVLETVGLAGYETRYPNELSGGERQRVAIARALVKNPRIILADEPTGNLDSKTSAQIMDLLKAISANCLVLIVSHNNEDAFNYADRIIRLEQGKIISDEIKDGSYTDDVTIESGTLTMPVRRFSEAEVSTINENIDNIVRIRQKDNKFVANNALEPAENKIDIQTKSLSFGDLVKLCFSFLKDKLFRITFSAFMIACLFVVLSIAQTLIVFNPSKVLADEMNKRKMDSFVMRKTDPKLVNNMLYEVEADEINEFLKTGYGGNVYSLYSHIMSGSEYSFVSQKSATLSLINNRYASNSVGVLLCDEAFVLKKHGINGEIQFLAGGKDGVKNGVIITDYLADSLLKHGFFADTVVDKTDYNAVIGEYKEGGKWVYGYINGVIKTNYKEKHKEYFDLLDKNEDIERSELISNELYVKFYDDVVNNLALTYSFNENFIEDDALSSIRNFSWIHKLSINGMPVSVNSYMADGESFGYTLNDNEIVMNYLMYNGVFGTEYKPTNFSTFTPHDVELVTYYYNDTKKENPIIKKTYKCVGLSTTSSICVNESELQTFKEKEFIEYALVFDDNENVTDILKVGNDLGFVPNSFLVDGIQTMNKAVEAFVPLFDLISIFLKVGAMLILVSFSFKMIKDKIHEIGILKALGTKNFYISVIFGLQILLIAVITCLFTFVGYALLVDLSNEILFESLLRITSLNVANLSFIVFNFGVLLKNFLLISALSLAVIICPFIVVRIIKPVKIIRAKD